MSDKSSPKLKDFDSTILSQKQNNLTAIFRMIAPSGSFLQKQEIGFLSFQIWYAVCCSAKGSNITDQGMI